MKKLISLILAVVITLSSMGVFAREYLPLYEDMEGVFRFDVGEFLAGSGEGETTLTPDMQKIKFLEGLGVWDDASKGENELVTLTEFSIIMSRLRLGSKNALQGVYQHNPNEEKATYKNAYEYLIEALGYIYMCKEFGNTDESLLVVASRINLLDEQPDGLNSYITRGALARLITKALTIDLSVIEYTDDGYRYNVVEGKNLLNSVHGIHELNGFVNAVEGIAIQSGEEMRDGCIQIDRRNVYANGLNLDEYLGARVKVYATLDENKNLYNIIGINYAPDHKLLEIAFENIVSITENKIVYLNDTGEEAQVYTDALKYVIKNGKAVPNLTGVDFRNTDGKIVLTVSEKGGRFDTAVVYEYHYFVSAYVDTFQHRLGLNFGQRYDNQGTLNEYVQFGERDIIKVLVDGKETPFEKIPANSAFRIFRCDNTGYTRIDVVTEKLAGVVEAKYDNVLQINETEYTLTKDIISHIEYCKDNSTLLNSQKVKELSVGMETTFYVFEDRIVCYTTANEFKFGYLKDVKESRTSIDPELVLRILTQEGEWQDFVIREAFELDGRKKASGSELIANIRESIELNEYDIVNNVVRYKANSKNEIIALDTAAEDPIYENDTLGSKDDIKLESRSNYTRNWTGDWISLSSPYFFSEETLIFVAPIGETNEDKFRVVKSSQLPGGSLPMRFYNKNDYNQILLAVCTASFDGAGSSNSESAGPFYYVEGIRDVVIDADNQEYGYRIMAKKLNPKDSMVHTERVGNIVDASFIVPEDMLNKNFVAEGETGYDPEKVIEVGDLIEAVVISGEAASWSMCLKGGDVDPGHDKDNPNATVTDLYKDRQTFDVYAKGEIISINPATRIMVFESEGVEHPAYMNVTAVIDHENNKIRLVTAADFKPGDRIYTYVRYGRMYFMVKNEEGQ